MMRPLLRKVIRYVIVVGCSMVVALGALLTSIALSGPAAAVPKQPTGQRASDSCSGYLPSGTVVAMAATRDDGGYWIANKAGRVVACGDATDHGSLSAAPAFPVVGMAATPDGGGYYLVASDGGVFAFGDAIFHGSTGAIRLNQPVVGMAVDHVTGGYWLVARDGGIFAFNAPFLGSMGATRLNKPVVGMAADPATGGYWLVAGDGGIFSFNAPFHGSTGNIVLNKPIVGMESSPSGAGYRFVASDGGVFAFNVGFYGSAVAPPSAPPPAIPSLVGTWLGDPIPAQSPSCGAASSEFQFAADGTYAYQLVTSYCTGSAQSGQYWIANGNTLWLKELNTGTSYPPPPPYAAATVSFVGANTLTLQALDSGLTYTFHRQ